MAKYQVATVNRPSDWTPECADDVPVERSGPVEVLIESDDLFEAVSRAMEHNESDEAQRRGRWAVAVEPGSGGRRWPAARLCTPIVYKVTAIWWPDGWEPDSPWDVPNCVWQAQGQSGGQWLAYPQAEATVLSLNRQAMDHPGTTWHVVVAVENEAVSRMVSYDRRARDHGRGSADARDPSRAGGHGNCTHCPAHDFQCAKADWSSQTQTVPARHSGAFGAHQ